MIAIAATCTEGAWHAVPAFAAEPDRLVAGATTCPDPRAVQAEVFRLTSPELRAQHLPGASVLLVDHGENYRIEIRKAGEVFDKTYTDPARECDKRVHFAAVYVVMTLMPPDFGDAAEADSTVEPDEQQGGSSPASGRVSADADTAAGSDDLGARPTAKANVADAPKADPSHEALAPTPQTPFWALELGVTGGRSWSTSSVPKIWLWGGDLQAELGRGPLRAVTGVELTPRAAFDIRGVQAKMLAVNPRAGFRFAQDAGKLVMFADAQLVLSYKRVEGESSITSEPESVWEWGALMGVTGGYRWYPGLIPLVGVRGSFFPAASELRALPRGTLGFLPTFWLGGLVGLRF